MKTVRSWAWTLCLLGAPVASQPPGGGLVTLPVDGTEDLTRNGQVFIRLTARRDTYFVQELVPLTLEVGIESRFLKTHIVQLFHRRLDVPVQVQAPWFGGLSKHTPEKGVGGSMSLALNDTVVMAPLLERMVAGRQFQVLKIARSFVPETAGEFIVPAPLLRFAYATSFHEDFIKGRVPDNKRQALVRGQRLELNIQPLPAQGRPPEFTGAVGRFSISAKAHPSTVLLGESFKLVLLIEGSGNVESFAPPRLDRLDGFHVLGKVDDKGTARRVVTYDLAVLSLHKNAVPPIRFCFFDPGPPPAYHTVETSPVPLTVRPLPSGTLPKLLANDKADGAVPGVNDIFGLKPGTPSPTTPPVPSPGLWWILALSPWLLALAWLWWCRTPGQDKLDRMQVRKAAAIFRRGTDVPEAFTRFLAALLNCPPAAVTAPDLEHRLEARGLPAELAAKAATLREELVAPRYGGTVSTGGEDAARALVEDVEASFQRDRGR